MTVGRVRSEIVAGLLILGLLASISGGSAAAAKFHNPPGAVKLAKANVKSSGRIVCGKLKSGWTPGSMLRSRYFIADAQQARNYKALAARSKGKAKQRYLALAKSYSRRAKDRQATCWHFEDPPGAVKLTAAKIKRIGKYVCGRPGATWVPGTLLRSGYFISDAQQAQNYSALAARSKGSAKSRYLALARTYGQRATARGAICQPVTKPPATPVPLRFHVSGAIALALSGSGAPSASVVAAGGSNLVAIDGAGRMSDAVSSGSATIGQFLIGPNNKLYVAFGRRVNLSDTSQTGGSASCFLAEVDPSSGVPTCIDSTLFQLDLRASMGGSGVSEFRNPVFQFDSSGAIVYPGATSTLTRLLRRYANGTTTDLITGNVVLNDFLVFPDGSILISGVTTTTGASWTRIVTPGGGLRTISNEAALFLSMFPDHRAYLGFVGVKFIDPGTGLLSSKWWIHQGGDTFNDTTQFCGLQTSPRYAMCSGGSLYVTLFQAGTDKEYGVVLGNAGVPPTMNSPALFELYPTLQYVPTQVTQVRLAQPAGANIVLSGLNASGQNVTTLLNTSTSGETILIGPASEYELYHARYVASGNRVLFDGLRFADNKYVVGQIDLTTNQLSVLDAGTTKWADLQAFN